MDYLLHIGTNKTGTSTLQYCLRRNEESLAAQNVLYPMLGTGRVKSSHHGLAQAINGQPGDVTGLPDDWRDQFAALEGDLAIFSSELFHTVDPEKVAAVFPPDRTRVVVYVREHAEWYASWYQQYVQSDTSTASYAEFVQMVWLSLADMLTRWKAVFGEDRVIAKAYDRDNLRKGDIRFDFFANVPALNLQPLKVRLPDKNPSLAGNLLFLKQLLNHFITKAESNAMVFELVALSGLDDTFQGRFQLDEQTLDSIRRRAASDRDALARDHGIEFKLTDKLLKAPGAPDLSRIDDDIALVRANLKPDSAVGPALDRLAQVLRALAAQVSPVKADAGGVDLKTRTNGIDRNDRHDSPGNG